MQVSVLVVERLEVVDIEDEDRERPFGEIVVVLQLTERGNKMLLNVTIGQLVDLGAFDDSHGHLIDRASADISFLEQPRA